MWHIRIGRRFEQPLYGSSHYTTSWCTPTSAPPLVAAVHDRDWELSALRAICLGRKVKHDATDSNETLIKKLAKLAKEVVALPAPAPRPPIPTARNSVCRPVAALSLGELRKECHALCIEHSISDTRPQLEEKLQEARDRGPASSSA